jgi:hypothetical protein
MANGAWVRGVGTGITTWINAMLREVSHAPHTGSNLQLASSVEALHRAAYYYSSRVSLPGTPWLKEATTPQQQGTAITARPESRDGKDRSSRSRASLTNLNMILGGRGQTARVNANEIKWDS